MRFKKNNKLQKLIVKVWHSAMHPSCSSTLQLGLGVVFSYLRLSHFFAQPPLPCFIGLEI